MLFFPLWGAGLPVGCGRGGRNSGPRGPLRAGLGFQCMGMRAFQPGEFSGGPQPTGRPKGAQRLGRSPPCPPPGPLWLRARHSTARAPGAPCFSGSAPSPSFLSSGLGRKCRSLGIWSPAFVLAVVTLGLHCFAQAFSSCSQQGPPFIAVCGLLGVAASRCRARALVGRASVVRARRLGSCAAGLSGSAVCGVFPDQGSNP